MHLESNDRDGTRNAVNASLTVVKFLSSIAKIFSRPHATSSADIISLKSQEEMQTIKFL